MSKNITLLGASYPDVPAVVLPQTGGGTALFTDVSDTTATAADVLDTSYFYDYEGTKTQGSIESKSGSDLSASGKTVTVPAGYYGSQATKDVDTATPAFDGGTLGGSISMSGSNVTYSSGAGNGPSVTVSATVTRAAVTYDGNVEGYVSQEDGDTALSADSSSLTSQVYSITGVTLEAPSSGTRQFSITVPNGQSTITFVFTVDSSGNVTVAES